MPNYYIRANGQSRTPEQLMNMLLNQEYPDTIFISGVVNAENPESMSWSFNKTENRMGEAGYSYSQMQVLFNQNAAGAGAGLAAAGAAQFVEEDGIVGVIQGCIDFFGPDAVAVNAPPMQNVAQPMNINNNFNLPPPPPLQAQQAIGLGEPAINFQPMNIPPNALALPEGQAGGRRRHRKVTRRGKTTRRRRISQRRRRSSYRF